MGTLYQMSIVTGILISYAINYLLRGVGPANWRWMFITGVFPSVLFFAMLLSSCKPRPTRSCATSCIKLPGK